jgi:hypothetical protein
VFSSLVLSGNVVAVGDEVFVEDTKTMTWPMLPGESLNDVARLFYPKNKAMQKQFVFKTLRLSHDIQPNLDPKQRFEEPTLLVIPTLKSLSNSARAIKSKKSGKQKLQLSLNLQQAVEKIPTTLIKEYESLLSKNAFLKEELAKLNEKIVFLQTKLNELKLILDKSLSLPPNTNLPKETSADAAAPDNNLPIKKEFKNLDNAALDKAQVVKPQVDKPQVEESTALNADSIMQYINTDLMKLALAAGLLMILGAYLLKKYRQRMFSNLSFVATKMQTTVQEVTDFIQHRIETKQEKVESVQEAQAAKEVSDRLDATLQEAKLLMSVNRSSDAIAHLKLTIEAQPKASISHWLYLLEIFRKLNLKDEFEQYAANMHQTFNVMTPVWYETEVAIYVPQSLEEFPHIMEKIYSVWPGELATVYLRNLINDNRGGERAGFGKAVLSEILMLIELLDVQKELN